LLVSTVQITIRALRCSRLVSGWEIFPIYLVSLSLSLSLSPNLCSYLNLDINQM
jgi:hypothetical protein